LRGFFFDQSILKNAAGAERRVSQFVQHHQVGFRQHLYGLRGLALGLFLLQRIGSSTLINSSV